MVKRTRSNGEAYHIFESIWGSKCKHRSLPPCVRIYVAQGDAGQKYQMPITVSIRKKFPAHIGQLDGRIAAGLGFCFPEILQVFQILQSFLDRQEFFVRKAWPYKQPDLHINVRRKSRLAP